MGRRSSKTLVSNEGERSSQTDGVSEKKKILTPRLIYVCCARVRFVDELDAHHIVVSHHLGSDELQNLSGVVLVGRVGREE